MSTSSNYQSGIILTGSTDYVFWFGYVQNRKQEKVR